MLHVFLLTLVSREQLVFNKTSKLEFTAYFLIRLIKLTTIIIDIMPNINSLVSTNFY